MSTILFTGTEQMRRMMIDVKGTTMTWILEEAQVVAGQVEMMTAQEEAEEEEVKEEGEVTEEVKAMGKKV